MAWIDSEIDGVAVKRYSIVGSSEWEKVFEQFMEYELAGLKDREEMNTGFGDPFNDTSDVTLSNAYLSSGSLRNTTIPAVPAQAGSNIVPSMTSNSQGGYVASASNAMYVQPYCAFYPTGDPYQNIQLPTSGGWVQIALPSAKILGSYKVTGCSSLPGRSPKTWTLQGSSNGSSWTVLDTRMSETNWGVNQTRSYTISTNTSYRYYRMNITAYNNGGDVIQFDSLQLVSKSIPYQPAYVNPATVTLDSYTSTEVLEAVKVKLWLENLDSSAAISCGNSGNDKIEVYLSYDGNSSFGFALNFPLEDIKATYVGSNIYIFTSEEIDVSADTITGLGLKVQSFARSVAPNFKLHGALVVGRPVTEE